MTSRETYENGNIILEIDRGDSLAESNFWFRNGIAGMYASFDDLKALNELVLSVLNEELAERFAGDSTKDVIRQHKTRVRKGVEWYG